MKTNTLIKSLLIGSLMAAPFVHATDTVTEKGENKMSQEQTTKSDKAIEKKQKELLETVNLGVVEGYKAVLNATKLLAEDGKEKKAIALLQEASGKFDLAIANDPGLNLVPIGGDVSVTALITTPELVEVETNIAIGLLKDNKVQAAQALLEPMKDEMVITNAYLPMGTYPVAIELATKLLIDGKKDVAVATLEAALSTVVIKKTIVPLAIVRTESLLDEASKLDKESKKDEARLMLDAALEQLEIATLLGYTDEDSRAYESLKSEIKAVRKEIDGKNIVEKMYDKVKVSINSLVGSESKGK